MKHTSVAVASLLVLSAIGAASAQTSSSSSSSVDPSSSTVDASSSSQQADLSQVSNIPADAHLMVGRKIVSSAGDQSGEVSDVLVKPDGTVAAILVKRGGVLGMGSKDVAVGWDKVKLQGDQVMVNMTADELGKLPDYTAK